MKLALLGADPDALRLALWVARSEHHQLVAVYDGDELYGELSPVAPLAAWSDSWESLLHGTVADAVIVARSGEPEMRAERLRKLVQAAIPMIVVHPVCEAIVGFELEMIRRDTGCVIIPYLPDVLHPAVERAIGLLQPREDNMLGHLDQVNFDRTLHRPHFSALIAQIASDVQLIRMLIGEVTKVAAMGTADELSISQNLGVQMSNDSGVLARWSLSSGETENQGRIALIGSHGTAQLTVGNDDQPWTMELPETGTESISADQQQASRAFDMLAAALRGEVVRPNWIDACRDCEIAEAVAESLRRGRTVDVRLEAPSEESTFMGIMAASGCGLLLMSVAALLVVAAVEGLRLPFRHHLLWRIWPFYLLGPIAVFLFLQLLKFAFPARDSHDNVNDQTG